MKENCIILYLHSPDGKNLDADFRTAFPGPKAGEIYTQAAREVYSVCNRLPDAQVVAAYERSSHYPDIRWLDQDDPGFLAARGESLEEKTAKAFEWCFNAGAKRVIWVSPMAVWLDAAVLEEAFNILKFKEVVIGPSGEKAYLFGVATPCPELCDGYPWRGKKQPEEITARARKSRLNVEMLAEGGIVMDEKSYHQWLAAMRKDAMPEKAEKTEKADKAEKTDKPQKAEKGVSRPENPQQKPR